VSRRTRKNLITSKEKILLHLLGYQKFSQDSAAPEAVTQEGVARAIGAGRNNVSKFARELITDGMVVEQQKHIKGMQRIRKAYFLSHLGFQEALRLKEEIETTRVKLVDFEGERHDDEVGRLNMYLPRNYSLIELADGVQTGVFNCASFHEARIKEERRYVDYTDRKPAVRVFFGREEELSRLKHFLEREEGGILSVNGIAGIGKTTLLAKFAQEVRDRTNLFWYRIHEWVTLKIMLSPLAEFLSQIGKKGLERYLTQTETPSVGEVCALLENDLKEVTALLIIDDLQKADASIVDFLTAMVTVMEQLPGIKVMVASREVPSFYSRSDILSGLVEEMALTGLDLQSAEKMLALRSIPQHSMRSLYEATDGHPLFLQLIEDPGIKLGRNLRRFIDQEVYHRLEIAERHILEILSVFRYPVLIDALFLLEEEIHRQEGQRVEEMGYADYMVDYDILDDLVAKSLLQESMGRMIGMHDLIREFFYGRLKPRQRMIFHRAAASFYLEEPSAPSLIEALHHSLRGSDFEKAIRIAVGQGREIISKGYAAPFEPLLRQLLADCPEILPNDLMEVLLLKGQIEDVRGEWDGATACYQQVLSIAMPITNRRIVADVHRRIGSIMLRRTRFDEALLHLETARNLAKEMDDAHTLVEVFYDLGGLAERTGQYHEGIEMFTSSRDLAQTLGDELGKAKALYGIGRVYGTLLEYDNAIEYKSKALRVMEGIGEANELAKVCTSLGNDFMAKGDMDSSLEYHKRAIELAESIGDINTLGYAFSNAAAVYLEKGLLRESEKLIEESSDIFSKLDDKIMISTMHLYRGFIHHKNKDWEWAKDEFNTSLEMLRRLGVPIKLGQWLYEIGQLYLENQDPEGALELFQEAREIANRMKHDNLLRDLDQAMNMVGA